jgi:hypothetical protein
LSLVCLKFSRGFNFYNRNPFSAGEIDRVKTSLHIFTRDTHGIYQIKLFGQKYAIVHLCKRNFASIRRISRVHRLVIVDFKTCEIVK